MAVGACFYAHPLHRRGAGVFSVRNVPERGETQGPRRGGGNGGGWGHFWLPHQLQVLPNLSAEALERTERK